MDRRFDRAEWAKLPSLTIKNNHVPAGLDWRQVKKLPLRRQAEGES